MTTRQHVVVVGGGLGGLAAAAVAAARGHRVTLLDKNPWLGGKAAVLNLPAPDGSGAFRFDMGPTILTVPRVLRRIYAEAGRDQARDLPMVRLDPQWRCFFADGTRIDLQEEVGAMARSMDAFAPGKGYGEGYRRFQDVSRTLHDVSERFFFWKPVEDLFDTIDFRANIEPGHAARRDGAAHGPDHGQGDPRPRAGRAAGADAGPLLPVRRLQPLPRAGGALLHRRHAGGRGRVVSARRHARGGGGAGEARRRQGRRAAHRRRGHGLRGGERRRGRRARRERAHRLRRGGLQHGRHPHLPRAARRQGGRALRAEVQAGLLGRGALPRPQEAVRAPGPPRLRLLARRGGGVRLHLPPRRAGAGPDRLPRRALRHRPVRRAGGRRGALRAGPHAAPAAGPGLGEDVPGLPPGHPRQAEAHGGDGGHRGAHRGRALA